MKDHSAYFRRLRHTGYTVTRTRKNHWQVRDKHGRIIATTGSTPSDRRSLQNLRAEIRRRGARREG